MIVLINIDFCPNYIECLLDKYQCLLSSSPELVSRSQRGRGGMCRWSTAWFIQCDSMNGSVEKFRYLNIWTFIVLLYMNIYSSVKILEFCFFQPKGRLFKSEFVVGGHKQHFLNFLSQFVVKCNYSNIWTQYLNIM